MKKIIKRLTSIILACSLIISAVQFDAIDVKAGQTSMTVSGVGYSFGNRGNYDLSDEKATSTNERIASISLSGDFNLTTKYNGVPAYGVRSGNVAISLDYKGKWLYENSKKYLLSDSGKTVNGIKMDAKIAKGCLMLQKSYDGNDWQLATNPIVNVFEDHKKGMESFYTTAGDDVKRGCYYRLILAYKYKEIEDAEFDWAFIHFDYDDKNDNKVAEVYKFFVCNNAGELSLHNKSADKDTITDIADGIKAEALLKGEMLLDGSVTKDGFEIDDLGVTFSSIKVNGQSTGNRSEYTEPGKYVVEGTTRLGITKSTTVYIYSGDNGFFDYFGENLINGNRVFHEGYPTYGKGTSAVVKKISDDIPAIRGTIENLTSGKKIIVPADRQAHTYKLDEGEYFAEFYSGNVDAGSVIRYEFHFNVLNEESGPHVNYNKLMTDTRICDLNTAHYEVVYPTTRGGYIFVCFETKEEAFKYAYDIEKRFVEKNKNGEVYYKSKDNPNEKVKYLTETDQDKLELTSAINYYAAQNVERAYFDSSKTFTYQTFEKGDDLLESLESMSIAESVKVFPSEEEKEINVKRMPYLNGYSFMHVDDYDVKSVIAECEANGQKYPIKFGKPIEDQLDVSSKYTITETNKYGDTLTYDAYFMAKNETESKWTVVQGGKTTTMRINSSSAEDGIISISADAISLEEIENKFDECAIISITTKDAYKYELSCLLKEAKGLMLYKKGEYTIHFVDRVGNSFTVVVNISGKVKREELDTTKYHTYSDIYNAVHLNDKEENN